jgi:hypothetical protein
MTNNPNFEVGGNWFIQNLNCITINITLTMWCEIEASLLKHRILQIVSSKFQVFFRDRR